MFGRNIRTHNFASADIGTGSDLYPSDKDCVLADDGPTADDNGRLNDRIPIFHGSSPTVTVRHRSHVGDVVLDNGAIIHGATNDAAGSHHRIFEDLCSIKEKRAITNDTSSANSAVVIDTHIDSESAAILEDTEASNLRSFANLDCG